MLILGIETSCDETSAAVVEDGRHVLSNVISSSKELFAKLAGVIPEEAARKQVECMIPVIDQALKDAKIDRSKLQAIAVTRGPGLLGSLLVGTVTGRTLARIWNLPCIGVHHSIGHLTSPWLVPTGKTGEDIRFPILTLSASGGHTDLWLRKGHMQNFLLGRTRDDASGEAFDKGAYLLSLPYPGGPEISKAAERGDVSVYAFSHPLSGSETLDFSFSGLKTELKYLLRDHPEARDDLRNVCASYQHAIVRHLLDRIGLALKQHDVRELHLVGGVSANTYLRQQAAILCAQHSITLRTPLTIAYCTDNAAMIAAAGQFMFEENPNEAKRAFLTEASLALASTKEGA